MSISCISWTLADRGSVMFPRLLTWQKEKNDNICTGS